MITPMLISTTITITNTNPTAIIITIPIPIAILFSIGTKCQGRILVSEKFHSNFGDSFLIWTCPRHVIKKNDGFNMKIRNIIIKFLLIHE